MQRGRGSKAPCILGLGHRRWWVISYVSKTFRHRGKWVGAYSIGRWMGPRINLDMFANRKNLNTSIENRTPDISTHDSTSMKCKHRYHFPARRWGISISNAVPICGGDNALGYKGDHNLGGAHSPRLYKLHPNFEPSTERILKPRRLVCA
jgi:hypothetical protein